MNAQGSQPDQLGISGGDRRLIFDRRGYGYVGNATIRAAAGRQFDDGHHLRDRWRNINFYELVDLSRAPLEDRWGDRSPVSPADERLILCSVFGRA